MDIRWHNSSTPLALKEYIWFSRTLLSPFLEISTTDAPGPLCSSFKLLTKGKAIVEYKVD